MRVISEQDLERLALSRGAKVELDGKTINGVRLVMKGRAPPPAPAPEKAAVVVETAPINLESLDACKTMLQELKDRTPPIERPRAWSFVVKRDENGLIERIEATAKG